LNGAPGRGVSKAAQSQAIVVKEFLWILSAWGCKMRA
jgi:hypothetical protein